ncbi:HEAT repeat domain-containing protein [Bacillus sp. REN10]|uniref:HEAT repeat domain-containing protein n=1 Tax=Bacillus sp. REN10 TaxID=2782541 RepID=UPI00193B2196|nr:HEAT repeat domain-containing protein [Bacillus sp. REN10]
MRKIEEWQAADKTDQVLSEILLYTDDKDFRVKLSAVEALSAFNCYPKAKNKLIQLTNSFSSEERMYALEQLGEFSGEDVGEAVLSKLQDPDSLVRISAVEVLGVIEYKKAIPALCH